MTYKVQFGRPGHDVVTIFEVSASSKEEARRKAPHLQTQYRIAERLTDVRKSREVAA